MNIQDWIAKRAKDKTTKQYASRLSELRALPRVGAILTFCDEYIVAVTPEGNIVVTGRVENWTKTVQILKRATVLAASRPPISLTGD